MTGTEILVLNIFVISFNYDVKGFKHSTQEYVQKLYRHDYNLSHHIKSNCIWILGFVVFFLIKTSSST